MTLSTISVTGTFQDSSLTGQAGSVTFTPSSTIYDSSGSLILTATPVVAVVTGGTMTPQTLVTTDNAGLLPSPWQYVITIAVAGASQSFSTAIPHSGSTVDVSTLAPIAPVTPPASPYVQSLNGFSGQLLISVVNGAIVLTPG